MHYTKQFPSVAQATEYALRQCARYAPIGVKVSVNGATVEIDRPETPGDAADYLQEAAQRLAGLAPRTAPLSEAQAAKIRAAREAISSLLEEWDV